MSRLLTGVMRTLRLAPREPQPVLPAPLSEAVLHAPDDDGPRLVAADWYDDHAAAARAEFIRVQCAVAALPHGDPRRVGLEWREAELWAGHGRDWLGAVNWAYQPRGPAPFFRPWVSFRRGFAECVRLTFREFWRHREFLGRVAPLRAWEVACDSLPASDPSAANFVDLAAAPLAGLRRFRFAGSRFLRLDARGAGELTHSPLAEGLASLEVPDNGLQNVGLWPVVRSSYLSNLRELDLSRNRLADSPPPFGRPSEETEPVPALAHAGLLPKLAVLNLRDNRELGNGSARAVASAGLWNLAVLDLAGTRVGESGVAALLSSDRLPNLRVLNLSGTRTAGAVGRLFALPGAARLSSLDLSGSYLSDADAEALAGCPDLATLVSLNLSDNGIGPAGARALADSPHLSGLKRLDLRDNPSWAFPPRESRTARREAAEALRRRFGPAVLL